jgi:hypothetical protein
MLSPAETQQSAPDFRGLFYVPTVRFWDHLTLVTPAGRHKCPIL